MLVEPWSRVQCYINPADIWYTIRCSLGPIHSNALRPSIVKSFLGFPEHLAKTDDQHHYTEGVPREVPILSEELQSNLSSQLHRRW